MENIQKEIRYITTELRGDVENNTISGTAILFNNESELLGGQFRELIEPSAATMEFLQKQEIIMNYQHDDNNMLARYSPTSQRNSLKFTTDSKGVHFEFKAKKKDAGIVESVAAGDLRCSFAFTMPEDSAAQKWEKRSDGTYLRTIKRFNSINDFALVIFPAYKQTSVNTRGLDELKQNELDEIKKLEEIRKYYENYKTVLRTYEK